MAASLRVGGYDFADEAPFGSGNIDRREYHHIFPKAFLEGRVAKRAVFSALNCALVSWRTNRAISAKALSVYIAERAAEIGIDRAEVDRRLRSHAIPPAALRADDFETFLDARAELIHGLMRRLCAGEVAGLHEIPESYSGGSQYEVAHGQQV